MAVKGIRNNRTLDGVRWLTIAVGAGSALVAGTAILMDGFGVAGEVDYGDLGGRLVLSLAAIWFVTNGIRFLDAKDSPWLRLLVLLPLGVAMMVFGFAQGFIVDHPASTQGDAYIVALAAVPIALGVATIVSGLRGGTEIQLLPISLKKPEVSVKIDPVSSFRRDWVRWLAIAGGVLLGVTAFVSPVAIPMAVGMTCAVRYADTLTNRGVRRVVLGLVALGLAGMIVAVFAATFEAEVVVVPGLALLLASAVLGMFRDVLLGGQD